MKEREKEGHVIGVYHTLSLVMYPLSFKFVC